MCFQPTKDRQIAEPVGATNKLFYNTGFLAPAGGNVSHVTGSLAHAGGKRVTC